MTSTPNTNPLTYASYLQSIATLAVINLQTVSGMLRSVNPEFNSIIPQMLNYAELRIQRDLDLLPLQTDNDTYALAAGDNVLQISVSDFVTVQNVRVISGTKKLSLTPVSKEMIDAMWDDDSIQGIPTMFAPYGGDASTGGNTWMTFLLGPTPDQNYALSVTGTTRAPSLWQYAGTSEQNTGTTFISTFLPDLLVMASMIFVSGYQRNWSTTSDDPQMGVNYEKQYQTLLQGAMGEELRKRFRASAWTSEASSPAGTPNRT